jgi:uncharacterized protein YlxW (UPF0749 family)
MSVASWVRNNLVAVATWAGVLLTLATTTAASMAISNKTQEVLVTEVQSHEEDIIKLESDVRSIREQQARLVKVVEKTEVVLTDLDRTTTELKVMVQATRP